MDDEERTAKFIQQQIEKAGGKDLTETEYTELKRDNEEEKGKYMIFIYMFWLTISYFNCIFI